MECTTSVVTPIKTDKRKLNDAIDSPEVCPFKGHISLSNNALLNRENVNKFNSSCVLSKVDSIGIVDMGKDNLHHNQIMDINSQTISGDVIKLKSGVLANSSCNKCIDNIDCSDKMLSCNCDKDIFNKENNQCIDKPILTERKKVESSCSTLLTRQSDSTLIVANEMTAKSSENMNLDSSEIVTEGKFTDELDLEIKKVKKRRSTIGRGRKSATFGNRMSTCTGLPILSLEDQIRCIPKDVLKGSKLFHMIDICIRGAYRKLEQSDTNSEVITDFRVDVLTQSENIARELSFKLSNQPLTENGLKWELKDSPLNKQTLSSKKEIQERIEMIHLYKHRTNELLDEYKQWKRLLRNKVHQLKLSTQEYIDAKTSATKIGEEDVHQLSLGHKCFLASRPDYNKYIQDVKTSQEEAFLRLQGIEQVSVKIKKILIVSKASSDNCYHLLENRFFGCLRQDDAHTTRSSQ